MNKKNDITELVKKYWSFPQIKVLVAIIFISIATLMISLVITNDYWSNVFSNIFSGLVTGIAIMLVSGTRQIYVAKLEETLQWLEGLHEQILCFKEDYRHFALKQYNGLSRDEFIYDMGSHANWINDYILASTFSNQSIEGCRYCKTHYGYDADSIVNVMNSLHDSLLYLDNDDNRQVEELFKPVLKVIFPLHTNVISNISSIKSRLKSIQHSIV